MAQPEKLTPEVREIMYSEEGVCDMMKANQYAHTRRELVKVEALVRQMFLRLWSTEQITAWLFSQQASLSFYVPAEAAEWMPLDVLETALTVDLDLVPARELEQEATKESGGPPPVANLADYRRDGR